MFHVLSWGTPFQILMLGTRTVFTSRFMDADSVVDAMVDWKVQLSTGVPTVWQGVRAAIEKRGVENIKPLLHLKMLTCGGSAPAPEMMKWFGDNLGVDFLQGWGMTETNPLGSLGRKVAKFADLTKTPEQLFGNMTKAGLPMTGVNIRIANADNLDEDMPS